MRVGGIAFCLELGQILTVHISNYQKDNRGNKKIMAYLWKYLLNDAT
jgi:hypothetical protein